MYDLLFQVNEDPGNGIILFSFGMTGFDSSTIPNKVVDMLMEVFSKFPQRFIVRIGNNIQNKPHNVMLVDWLPQHDILGN